MKNVFILLILCFCASNIDINAKEVTVTVGAGYSQQVFYSLATDEMTTVPIDEWDIAFETGSNAGILFNTVKGATGMKLYYYPESQNFDDIWAEEIDTTGMSANWEKCFDSEISWSVGAFNRGKNGFVGDGDFGWGLYNMATHGVLGYALYVMKLSDGSYKKIMITNQISGVVTFLVADIDGKNEKEYEVDKKNYGTKNIIYFSLATGDVIDREPLKGAWDLLFSKYSSALNNFGSVTGVKSNKGVKVAQVGEFLIDNAPVPDSTQYTDTITAIGSDWKKFILSESKYEINDMIIYFIEATDLLIYKIAFRDFGGSATGDIVFEKQELQTSVEENNGNASSFAIYPNVVANNQPVNLVYSLSNTMQNVTVQIFNIYGAKVYSSGLNNNGSLNTFKLDVSELASGSYLVNLDCNGISHVRKLIVQ